MNKPLDPDQVIAQLRLSYDNAAERRDNRAEVDWKRAQAERFLSELQRRGKQRLLEIGSGPGKHGKFFQDAGLDVICTDLSPEMVRLCREKGLEAHLMDFRHLHFPPQSFDAVFAMNSLLHAPKQAFPAILADIADLLAPGGLFFMAVYGGRPFEGVWPDDSQTPPRFFAFYSDDALRQIVSETFDILTFEIIQHENSPDLHTQALTLRPSRSMPPIQTPITRLFDENDIPYTLLPHDEPVFTVATAAAQRGVVAEEMVKSILLREKGGQRRYVMACVLGHMRLDYKAVRRHLGEDAWKRLTFASAEEIANVTGYVQGAVAPLCLPADVPVIFDPAIAACENVNISSGDPLAGIELKPDDLVRLAGAQLAEIAG